MLGGADDGQASRVNVAARTSCKETQRLDTTKKATLHLHTTRTLRGRRERPHQIPAGKPDARLQGDLEPGDDQSMLRDDHSQVAKELLHKLVTERGTGDMMISLADCLREYIPTGISDEVVREQLELYAKS